jgi:dUTP pyrophosphatase
MLTAVKYSVREGCLRPSIGTGGSVGIDLPIPVDCVVERFSQRVIDTGISFQFPEGYFGLIAQRSSVALIHGIEIFRGIIDPDYTGSVKLVVINRTCQDFQIKCGDRLAQIVILKTFHPLCLTECVADCLQQRSSERGSEGFGSTSEGRNLRSSSKQ